jgi:hypothetical protein
MLIIILKGLVVVVCACAAAIVLCATIIGVYWHATKPRHEADDAANPPALAIPADREFTDPLDARASHTLSSGRGKGEGLDSSHPSSRSNPSSFPQDHSYQSAPAKRF